jgi:hypothetical protein
MKIHEIGSVHQHRLDSAGFLAMAKFAAYSASNVITWTLGSRPSLMSQIPISKFSGGPTKVTINRESAAEPI